jgi:hypothetical protein
MFITYKDDPTVAYAYATTLSSGEFWMPPGAWRDATNKGKVTPAQIQTFGKAIIDAWTYALGEKKVVWTSAGGWTTADPNNVVSTYALNTKGTQLREGLAESITGNVTQPLIGQGLTDLAVRPSDEQNSYQQKYLSAKPMQQIGRDGLAFYGDEFEKAAEIYNGGPTYAGVFDSYEYYRMAVLNMLRKGENYAIFPEELRKLLKDDDEHLPFAVLRDYFRQTAGYPENQAPDGWAVLQVWYHGDYSQRRYHNYEKYVMQREVTGGGLTRAEVPSEEHVWDPGMFAFSYANGVTPKAYFSKSTHNATSNNYMYFDVDDGFANSGSQYRIAVTYKDVSTATWRVEYTDTNGGILLTDKVANQGDGKLKTAIFNVPRIAFADKLPTSPTQKNMDFRIYNGGSADVTISSVRILRY